jgi:integrase
LALFTAIETSPRAARNLAKGRPYSIDTIQNYQCYYRVHLKGDPLMDIKLDEVDETCLLQFINRLSNHHIMQGKRSGAKLAGTDTFGKILKFVRMAFTEYQKTHRRWINPFQTIDPPMVRRGTRGALSEEEVIKLFTPGILLDEMELAVCAAMFLAGLRRSEIFALRPEDLDWCTPKIMVCRAWQSFDSKTRILGPPKSKKARQAPFDTVLQGAIKKLWEVNGHHEFVFSFKDGTTPGPSWIKGRFKKWMVRAGIDLNGRRIVPHSARHSLASILEERGVSLRYIQDMLGHSDLKTTKIYLHSTEKTIRDIGSKIDAVMDGAKESTQPPALQIQRVG